MIGILIGLTSTVIRSIVTAAAVDAVAAAATAVVLLGLPVIGWLIFRATRGNNIGWIVYAVTKKFQKVLI